MFDCVKSGDVITLRDLQTLLHLLPGDMNVSSGMDLLVTEVFRASFDDVCEYTLISTDTTLSILVKRVGHLEDYRVMFSVDGVPSGDRQDWIDAGANWLFLPPSKDDYSAHELEYTEEIWNGEVCYTQKHGSLYGSKGESCVIVHEWTAGESNPDVEGRQNPEIVVIETSGSFSRRGGFITFLQGAYVAASDMQFLSVDVEE